MKRFVVYIEADYLSYAGIVDADDPESAGREYVDHCDALDIRLPDLDGQVKSDGDRDRGSRRLRPRDDERNPSTRSLRRRDGRAGGGRSEG